MKPFSPSCIQAAIFGGLYLASCSISLGGTNHAESVYATYDREFRTFLAEANKRAGKEVIKVERLSEQFTVPQKLTIKGTPYEVGLTIGEIGKRANLRLPMLAETNRALNQRVIELYKKIYPQQLELIRGAAEVYGQPTEQIDTRVFAWEFTAHLWWDLLKVEKFFHETAFEAPGSGSPIGHCSVASCYTKGHQLVGRNFDNPSDFAHYFTITQLGGSYKVMGHTIFSITSGPVDGMNEKGLSFCIATASTNRESYPDEPAILVDQMSQVVLETCTNVDQALGVLRTTRVWFPLETAHCLLADATGKAVVIEWNPENQKLLIFDKPRAYQLLTNTPLEKGEDMVMKSCWRYRTAKPLLEGGVREPAGLLEIMEAIRPVSGPSRTLWTSMMDLNAGTFEVYYFEDWSRQFSFHF